MSNLSETFKNVMLKIILDYRTQIPNNIEGTDEELIQAYDAGYSAAKDGKSSDSTERVNDFETTAERI